MLSRRENALAVEMAAGMAPIQDEAARGKSLAPVGACGLVLKAGSYL